MKKQNEFELQKQICNFLNLQYPKVKFLSDTIASIKLTIPQQIRNKQIQDADFKTPDLLILQPNDYYHGLFIELKTESPFKKDGTIKRSQNDHLLKQWQSIQYLNALGYCACFSWVLEETIKIINGYMRNEIILKK